MGRDRSSRTKSLCSSRRSLLDSSDTISIDTSVVSSQEFGVLLEMIYTGRLPLGKHNASRIVAAADSLQMFDVAVGFKKVLTTLVGQKVPVLQASSQEETSSARSENRRSETPNQDNSASEKMETIAEDKRCHDNKEDEEEATGRKACEEGLGTSGLFPHVTVIYPKVC